MTRPWLVRVAQPTLGWISANGTSHRMAKARLIKEWRRRAYGAAVFAGVPQGLDRVRVDVEFVFIGRSPVREIENLRPTLKAIVDGAIGPARGDAPGRGVVPDDSDKHLEYGSYVSRVEARSTVHTLCGRVELTITDLSGGEPA
jgi:hypothetical protein